MRIFRRKIISKKKRTFEFGLVGFLARVGFSSGKGFFFSARVGFFRHYKGWGLGVWGQALWILQEATFATRNSHFSDFKGSLVMVGVIMVGVSNDRS